MKSAEIRQAFLDFFAQHGHQVVPSSSLIPHNDPSLLFTNAGMVQFKDVFLGRDKRDYVRAASSQRVVRAGGKHNDLDNVGYTARHHTFFEMLGNFSFGDYFKREAIHYAWDFLTQILKLPKEKLWVTVFKDDKEAEAIWLNEVGIDPQRFSRLGEKDNFWAMGNTGPCGPCTEIFYDHGPEIAGGPPGSPDEDGDRYIEVWNLVFMQYDRQESGELIPLPKPSVDTGMGLERISAVMQQVHNNYEIDLFASMIRSIAALLKIADLKNHSLRVIADHIRSCAFLVVDGVFPSNEGRGYVLRRIIRRAARHGHQLGADVGFFSRCVKFLIAVMGDAYPELRPAQAQVEKVLLLEEEKFSETLAQGLKLLEKECAQLTGDVIPGQILFTLYDTYGFPLDLTADIAREKHLKIDQMGFDAAMAQQQAQSRQAGQFRALKTGLISGEEKSQFTGYESAENSARLTQIYHHEQAVSALATGEQGIILLDNTPFYAESGGQVGDRGEIRKADGSIFIVEDTQKEQDAVLHIGYVASGVFQANDCVTARFNETRRQAIRRNHSATHLLHAVLRQLLGPQVQQKGSLVDDQKLRFDFSWLEPISADQLQKIEKLVNQKILENTDITTELMDLEAAKQKGAMALFGEKYTQQVRVLSMGREDFSVELCGGTHAQRTGDIGLFKILSESGVAAGVRRIEAVTGEVALVFMQKQTQQLGELAQLLKSNPEQLVERIQSQFDKQKELEKNVERLSQKLLHSAEQQGLAQVRQCDSISVLAICLEDIDAKNLRAVVDRYKQTLGEAVIALASVKDNKVSLCVGVTDPLCKKLSAGVLVNYLAQQVGGKGGGRPDLAMAGGDQPAQLTRALNSVYAWVSDLIAKN